MVVFSLFKHVRDSGRFLRVMGAGGLSTRLSTRFWKDPRLGFGL